MNFQDSEKNSVQSLLALLRSTQDATGSTAPAPGDSSGRPQADRHGSGRSLSRGDSGHVATSATGTSGLPSAHQLNDLLRSLNGAGAPSLGSSSSQQQPGRSEPIAGGSSRTLIEPFGPITNLTRPLASPVKRKAASDHVDLVEPGTSSQHGDIGTWAFAKALPKVGEMMGDERFMSELRKMKADQDALERRMWAKQEKIKADHERTKQAERDIARITRKPITPEKQAATLDQDVQDFHRRTCLPSLDSLSRRHRERLLEMGVPGLAGDPGEAATVMRWRKIMDLLQAGLEE